MTSLLSSSHFSLFLVAIGIDYVFRETFGPWYDVATFLGLIIYVRGVSDVPDFSPMALLNPSSRNKIVAYFAGLVVMSYKYSVVLRSIPSSQYLGVAIGFMLSLSVSINLTAVVSTILMLKTLMTGSGYSSVGPLSRGGPGQLSRGGQGPLSRLQPDGSVTEPQDFDDLDDIIAGAAEGDTEGIKDD